jgi:tetratricopeptide (TPR) repeat protein
MATELSADKIKNLAEAGSQFDQAKLKVKAGDFPTAQALLQNAQRMRQLALGNDDPGLADIADELGFCYLESCRYEEANQQFKAALAILEKKFYPGHARHYPVLEHLADCLIRQNEYAEAEPILKRALEISEKTVSGEHRAIFELIWKLTNVYLKLEKYTDAEAVLAKALKQLDTPLGPIDEFRYQFAVISAALGKDKEAEAAFQQAIEGLQQRKDYKRLGDCLASFAEFLKKAGRLSEAETMSKHARLLQDAYRNSDHGIFPATLLRA